jgi:hypothetical protein
MAKGRKYRYINTRFWNDSYISDLDPVEKLLFIYFLTNEHTNICGVYELPLKVMSIETGIEKSMLQKVLKRLRDKIRYIGGMVVIKNFVKHQENDSDTIKTGIVNKLKEIPIDFLKNVILKGYYELPAYCMDTLSIPYTSPMYNSNSNSNSNSNTIAEAPQAWTFGHFLLSLKESSRKELRVLGRFFETKKLTFETKGQAQTALKRHIRAAKDVAEFSAKQIDWAMDKAIEEYPDKWTLETLTKLLTK